MDIEQVFLKDMYQILKNEINFGLKLKNQEQIKGIAVYSRAKKNMRFLNLAFKNQDLSDPHVDCNKMALSPFQKSREH